jgi:hypothetical protein
MNSYNYLLKQFPLFELSYEHITHKKVQDVSYFITNFEGNKIFLWFTQIKGVNHCFLLGLNTKKQVNSIKFIKIAGIQDPTFYYGTGTIVYGSLLTKNKETIFVLENLYYYKNKFCGFLYFKYKLNNIKQLLNSYNIQDSEIAIFLPIICTNFDTLMQKISQLPPLYKVTSIIFRYEHKHTAYKLDYSELIRMNNIKNNDSKKNVPMHKHNLSHKFNKFVFKVIPDIQNDIYHLFYNKNGNLEEYGLALIPSYTTSTLMNKLFRNIKENNNLDYLEESDDENEFENSNIDKFVYLDKYYYMVCEYNYKFKKWVPLNIVENVSIETLVTYTDLINYKYLHV